MIKVNNIMDIKLIVISCLLVLICTVGFACASDDLNNHYDGFSSTNIQDIDVNDIQNDVDIVSSLNKVDLKTLSVSENDALEIDDGNFGDLYNDVYSADGILKLERDYVRNGNENPHGIGMDKCDFVIDGQGHTIDGSGNGRIFQFGGDNITLKNINFINGKYCTVGGAIYSEASLHIINCTFKNNKGDGSLSSTDYEGGAIYSDTDLYLDGCVFDGNYADDWGGAVYCRGKLYINSLGDNKLCCFINNEADDHDGGAIYCEGDAFINYAEFSDNLACGKGGAVHCSGTLKVRGSRFTGNRVDGGSKSPDYDGGAISSRNDLYVDDCYFDGNYADDFGGAIYAKGNVYINNMSEDALSYFKGNKADDDNGGAIYCEGTIYANNAVFSGNCAIYLIIDLLIFF